MRSCLTLRSAKETLGFKASLTPIRQKTGTKPIVVKGEFIMFVLKKYGSLNFKNYQPPKEPQILDLLQLSRKERECRNICIRTMRKFNDWRKSKNENADPFMHFYEQVEGVLLRRQAQDAVLFYRLIRKDRRRAFDDYISKLPSPLKVMESAR